MANYYGFQTDGKMITLYRVKRNGDDLVIALDAANAKIGWTDVHGALEYLDNEIQKISLQEAQTLAESFHITL